MAKGCCFNKTRAIVDLFQPDTNQLFKLKYGVIAHFSFEYIANKNLSIYLPIKGRTACLGR